MMQITRTFNAVTENVG